MMFRLAALISVWLCGCESFPADDYSEECTTDADCLAPWRCLDGGDSVLGPRGLRCSVPCESADECPRVVSQHCGDQTVCTNDGCSFAYCD